MLKSEMQSLIQAMEDQLLDYENTQRVDRDLIKSAADKERKHSKLRRHVDKALCTIGGIMAVNCRDIQEWHKHGNASLMYASDMGEDAPACPPITELYSSLRHIEEILERPVEESKEDHMRHFR